MVRTPGANERFGDAGQATTRKCGQFPRRTNDANELGRLEVSKSRQVT